MNFEWRREFCSRPLAGRDAEEVCRRRRRRRRGRRAGLLRAEKKRKKGKKEETGWIEPNKERKKESKKEGRKKERVEWGNKIGKNKLKISKNIRRVVL